MFVNRCLFSCLCLCECVLPVYGVIKNNNNNNIAIFGLHFRRCFKYCLENFCHLSAVVYFLSFVSFYFVFNAVVSV